MAEGIYNYILSIAACSEIFLYFTAVLSDLKPKLMRHLMPLP